MIESIRRRISNFIFSKVSPEKLTELINAERIKRCEIMISKKRDSKFYEQANVINLARDRNKIKIGTNTHVRGELLVFPSGEITIGNNCYLGEGSRIWSQEKILIMDNVLISHNVNIHDTNSHPTNFEKRHSHFKQIISSGFEGIQENIETAPIIINNDAWIGFNSIILKGVTVGNGAIIAAGSVVTDNVPEFTLVGGNPARVLKKLSV